MKNWLITIPIVYIFCLGNLNAQDLGGRWNNYHSYSLSFKASKKITVKAGQLYCFDMKDYRLQYIQFKLGASYKIKKKWSADVYYKPMIFRGTTQTTWYHRLSTALSYRSKLFKLPLKQTVIAEWHFPQLRKFQYRFIYTLQYSFKNKILPLRATPYLKYQLYYYQGGRAFDYYDDAGEVLLATQAPNGFHRYRLGAGIRFRPAKRLYVTLYYVWQQEFNTTFTENRQLNRLNKQQSSVRNPFNDYQVLGLSLSYSIKKKKKKKKT